MALKCVTNVCGDIHVAIPTVVMFEMLLFLQSLLWLLCRNFHCAIHSVDLSLL